MKYIKSFLVILLMGLAFIVTSAFAVPFSIIPNGPLPTSIQPGGVASASYTITNITSINPPWNSVKYLPPNVQIDQTTSTCKPSSGFVLAPRQSCRLNLTISGSVSNTDSNPRNHLFVCMSDAATCGGPTPADSLNVAVTTNINPILYGVSGNVLPFAPAANNNLLYMLDTATANAALIMPLSDGGNAPVIASDGNSLYHFSGTSVGFTKSSNSVFEIINLKSLTTSAIPLSGQSLGAAFGAVFYRNANAFLVTNTANHFNTLSTSGFSAQIGTMAINGVTGLACYNHNVYGATSDRVFSFTQEASLLRINPSNGAILSSTPITLAGYTVNAVQGLTVNPTTGTFYAALSTGALTAHGMSEPQQKLVTIDVNTGIATLIGNISKVFLTSIAFNPSDSSC
jgi:hypothetical protein